MNSERTIDQLVALVCTDPTNMAARLELAKLYAQTRDFPNALTTYEEVAKRHADQGLPLKAIAVYKQICSMVVADAPHLRHRYAHVPPILSDLFESLGLKDQAVGALDALGDDGRHGPS